MKRVLLLIVVAGITFLIIMLVSKPDMLDEIWIWLVGLSGLIIKSGQSLLAYFKDLISDDPAPTKTNTPAAADNFAGNSLKLMRLSDDGNTTIGMLFINEQFYCYTLEDTGKRIDNPAETRIPEGTYPIQFNKETDQLTTTYKNRYPEWFSQHLQLKQVPNYSSVYIHHGGTHQDTTLGCILVADSLELKSGDSRLTDSMVTYRRLYEFIAMQLSSGKEHRISIYNESWINQLKPTA